MNCKLKLGLIKITLALAPVLLATSVRAQGNVLQLFYNANTGNGVTGSVSAVDGTFTNLQSYDGGFSLWTHIVGMTNGLVLFYDAATGNGATGYIDPGGNFTTVQLLSGFSPWTHITWVGGNLLLFYDANTRHAASYRPSEPRRYLYNTADIRLRVFLLDTDRRRGYRLSVVLRCVHPPCSYWPRKRLGRHRDHPALVRQRILFVDPYCTGWISR